MIGHVIALTTSAVVFNLNRISDDNENDNIINKQVDSSESSEESDEISEDNNDIKLRYISSSLSVNRANYAYVYYITHSCNYY